jgi:hypothetical protein
VEGVHVVAGVETDLGASSIMEAVFSPSHN